MRTGSARVARGGGRRDEPTLTFRASLNALAALVDYGARAVVQLVLAPLLLRYLGDAGYGIWQVLQKLIGHTTPAGGRPGEALKWTVAQGQRTSASTDEAEVTRRRQQVGTAIAVWAMFLPLVVVLGLVLAWISPDLVHAHPDQVWMVRAAAVVLVLNVVVLGIAAVPQSVLQGENLGYRRLGLSTAMLLIGGATAALALWAGYGLVGVAIATVLTTALSGLTYLYIVRGQVSWWGVRRPARGTVRAFVGLSWWFLLWNLVMQLVKGSDVIVLSAIAGASLVTVYTLTSFVPQSVTDLVFMVISATMPGLGGLVGAGELDRAARVRNETMVVSWLVSVGAGATIIVWQPAFLAIWVGEKYDAGTLATVLICVMVTQLALIRVDSNVIDLTLRVRAKVLLGLFSALLGAGLGMLLAGPFDLGISGLVTGLLLGRLPLTVAYPVLVGRLLKRHRVVDARAVARPLAASVLLCAVAVLLRPFAAAEGWFALVSLGSLSAAALLLLAYITGLDTVQRRSVRRRAMRVVHLR
jgi:O-antigen/teichoic acid export membrane protein